MILPGVSGSYILLIFGMYDVVIGSLSAGALREDFLASAWIVGPVALGAAAGIGLLSNLLKHLLARYGGPSHGFLLGLLVGAVVGLYPFQVAVHPELATKAEQKAVLALVEGQGAAEVRAAFDVDWSDDEATHLAERYAGASRGELKALGLELEHVRPGALQAGGALGLMAAGFAPDPAAQRRARSACARGTHGLGRQEAAGPGVSESSSPGRSRWPRLGASEPRRPGSAIRLTQERFP